MLSVLLSSVPAPAASYADPLPEREHAAAKEMPENRPAKEAGGELLPKEEILLSTASDAEQKVRVIIELEEDSLIQEAINQNVEFQQLEKSYIEEKREELKEDQEKLIDELERTDIEADTSEVRHYDAIFNGIALSVEQGDIEEIEALPKVKKVYISQEYQRPLLRSSNQLIGSSYAWNTFGYKGEGVLVAVIDSGIDPTHKAMKLDDPSKAKLRRDEAEALISDKGLRGGYYSDKIPYGYNYYDENRNLFDSYGVMHGMHVSGIVGANDAEGQVFGVAPNAQILGMKVFSDDLQYPTTFTDIWLKAINDAILLDADIINMSLGSAAGFSIENREYPEGEMIAKAKQAGIVVVVAAGNDGTITDGNIYGVKPLEENYDTALIANPALNEETIAVASMENLKQNAYIIKWTDEHGIENQEIVALQKAKDAPAEIGGGFIDLKEGHDAILRRINLSGKFAFIEIPKKLDGDAFLKKLEKIASQNPAAIILYNHRESPDTLGRGLEVEGKAADFTIARIKYGTYQRISLYASSSFDAKLSLPTQLVETDNIEGGNLSAFSSWGPTPDLRIKPEITAPGGKVYSTAEEDEYKTMSGTSMASPQVAGAGAVLKQYIREKNIPHENASELIKLILMNTARPIFNPKSQDGQAFYFVRQQGSGLMDLENALSTKVLVRAEGSNDDKADGKLELKELEDKRFEVKLSLQNFSDQDKEYRIQAQALYEPIERGYRTQSSEKLISAQNDKEEFVEVPANSTVIKEFTIDYSDAQQLKENNFIEGYLLLSDEDGEANLSVPFLGFYGSWEKQKAIDAFDHLPELGEGKRNVQFYANKDNGIGSSMFMTTRMLPLPVIKNIVYFSPSSTYHRELALRLAPLRNMEEIEYSILDASTMESLRVIGVSKSVRKLNRLKVKNSFVPMPASVWDGNIGGMPAQEGKPYIYQIKAKLNTNTGEDSEQIFRYLVAIDRSAPLLSPKEEIKLESIDERKKEISFRVKDEGSGLMDVYLQSIRYVKDEINISPPQKLPPGINLPPGVNPAPPGRKDSKSGEEAAGEELAKESGAQGNESASNQPKGKKKYGKYLRISFVDTPVKDGVELLKVVDKKLEIPQDQIPNAPEESRQIYVYSNGYGNEEIEIKTPFFADTAYIHISAKDHLSNTSSSEIESGVSQNYNTIHFMDFHRAIRERNAEIFIDDTKLDQAQYSTTKGSARIKIKLPNEDAHLSTLYVKKSRKVDYILKEGKAVEETAKKYDYAYLDAELAVEFAIDDLNANYEIVTIFKDGPMPKVAEKKEIRLDLSKALPDKFRTIKVSNREVELSAGSPVLNIESGSLYLELIFKEGENKPVKKIILHQKGEAKELPRRAYFDLVEGKQGYNASPYAIKIRADLEEDAEIEILYEQESQTLATGSDALFPQATPSDAEQEEEGMYEDLTITEHEGKDNQKEGRYPVIFIQSPRLLDVATLNTTENDRIKLSGFIGNIKQGDEIDRVEVKLIDKDGKDAGETIILQKDDLLRKFVNYRAEERTLYRGFGYHFETDIQAESFNVNIRVEVFTKKQESASVVRRLFYDKLSPEVYYEVFDRELDSDSVRIKIHSKDNSLILKLYREDSLIGSEDKTSISFEGGGVELVKEINVPLKEGQNEIRISAEDLANYHTEKTIYIFRSK
ncbi:MAG: S8 family serine peptidase [Johnsonella sp.]|nr:S8 family serine peptidase [Johnsonella sp.]